MARAHWGTRLGFILAVAGSAIGLANVWKFPFMVGRHGGSAFIIVYLLALATIGFPVFVAEVLIGRDAQSNPKTAFNKLGGKGWAYAGAGTILTGFIVSAFYSAVAGWVLGYLIEALRGGFSTLHTVEQASQHFHTLVGTWWWGLLFHVCFITLASGVLYLGVRGGIERCNKIFMPALFILLVVLVIRGVTMPKGDVGLAYLLSPDWSLITPGVVLAALGQAFFTLSLGQGTMVTYGSYLESRENLISSCLPAIVMDTMASLLAAVAVFSIVFAVGMEPNSGPGLTFQTLPLAFMQIPLGGLFAVLFFVLIFMAALTSEISAMEPTIAYLTDEWGLKRHSAVVVCGLGAMLLGIPCALSYSLLSDVQPFGFPILDFFDHVATQLLIPLGGFAAIVLVGWVWGVDNAITHLKQGATDVFKRHRWLTGYFWFCFKYLSPFLMLMIFLHALGFLF